MYQQGDILIERVDKIFGENAKHNTLISYSLVKSGIIVDDSKKYIPEEVEKMSTRSKPSWIALDSKIIAVGVAGEADDWAAYIGAVPGICHRDEWQSVEKRGAKLPQRVAEAIFPQMSHLKWRG